MGTRLRAGAVPKVESVLREGGRVDPDGATQRQASLCRAPSIQPAGPYWFTRTPLFALERENKVHAAGLMRLQSVRKQIANALTL